MELEIGKVVKVRTNLNTYIIEVKMMHGDGDHYTTKRVRIPEDKIEMVKEVIGVLEEMLNLPWNDAREKYRQMSGFLAWFGGEFLGKEDDEEEMRDENWDERVTYEKWEEICNYSFEWDKDVKYTGDNARLDGYKVFYYDEDALKHEVKVVK